MAIRINRHYYPEKIIIDDFDLNKWILDLNDDIKIKLGELLGIVREKRLEKLGIIVEIIPLGMYDMNEMYGEYYLEYMWDKMCDKYSEEYVESHDIIMIPFRINLNNRLDYDHGFIDIFYNLVTYGIKTKVYNILKEYYGKSLRWNKSYGKCIKIMLNNN